MYLETTRVSLREITAADEEKLLDLDSDPEVMRYISNGEPSSREDVLAAIERILALKEKHEGRFGCWAAIEKASGQFMGWFLFRPAHRDAENVLRIELGYRLKKAYWGRGFATEVSFALVAKGFEQFGVDEIFAVAFEDNEASQAVMRKVGMEFTHAFTSDEFGDEIEDLVEFSILRKNYSRP